MMAFIYEHDSNNLPVRKSKMAASIKKGHSLWNTGCDCCCEFNYYGDIIIIMFIVSNNINSCTYNQSADQLLNTFKTMEKKQIYIFIMTQTCMCGFEVSSDMQDATGPGTHSTET